MTPLMGPTPPALRGAARRPIGFEQLRMILSIRPILRRGQGAGFEGPKPRRSMVPQVCFFRSRLYIPRSRQ